MLKKNEKSEDTFSITSPKENFSRFDCYIAISPDGRWEFTLYNTEDPSNPISTFQCEDIDYNEFSKPISTFLPKDIDIYKPCYYSLAISNCINDDSERLVALSCFDRRKMCYEDDNHNQTHGHDDKESHTWVISTTDKSEMCTSLGFIGGAIRFLDSNVEISGSQPLINKTVIIIVNVSGIYKQTLDNDKIMMKQEFQKQNRFLKPSFAKIEKFELPQQLSISLSRLEAVKDIDFGKRLSYEQKALELLHTSIIKNYFMAHSFENQQQIIEMYSLITGDLEMLFKRHECSTVSNIIRGSPVFAISQNEGILAFCRGTVSITLYLMENGLEITTKQLEDHAGGIYKIVAMEFIDNDSKLLIVLEEEHENLLYEISMQQIFIIWDLFTTFKDSIRQIDYSDSQEPLKMDATHRLINSHGNMLAVTDSGDIISVLDHVASIRNPPSIKEMNKIDIVEKNQMIIQDVEPWNSDKQYFRLSVWTIHWPSNTNVLEGACQALCILGRNKPRTEGFKNINRLEYLIKCTQRLVRKYITKYGIFRLTDIRYSIMRNLIKGNQESLIKLILNKKINGKNSNIHIPRFYKWVIDDKSDINISEKISETSISIDDTIKTLKTSSKLKLKPNTDLHKAIRWTIQRRVDSTAILKYLIDYYADNAKEYNNDGWMFTVTKAIPLLYDYQLDGFVQNLFKKPCFGVTEAYTPPLHINPQDQKKGNNAAVIHILVVKPCLASKPKITLLENIEIKKTINHKKTSIEINTSYNDRKVYKVPLPDFMVYPKGLKDHHENYYWFLFTLFRIFWLPRKNVINNISEKSPFLRVIHEEKSFEIYQTPAIMSILDFKWPAARQHFIRHIILYILYVISFSTIIGSYSSNIAYLFKTESKIILKISIFVYCYTGWYLIVTEIMQSIREGWRRYLNIYNMFDLASVFLPLACNIVMVLNSHGKIILQTSVFNSVLAFTALFTWLELVGPGRFIHIIKSILKTIWPFLTVMFIVIVSFGHAMFILLNHTDDLQIPTYKIENSDLYSNISIKQDIDKYSRLDNYYSNFLSSVEAVFFWTNGRWDQLGQWDNYGVDVMSILGSIILVDVFDKANKESYIIAYKYRAQLVAEYDTLEKPFGSERGNPRYIYYIPNPDMIDTWLKETKKAEDEKNLIDNSSYSKKYKHIQSDDCLDTTDAIEPITTKYTEKADKIIFIDEEKFELNVTSKSNQKSQINSKSSSLLFKNKSSEPFSDDDQLSTSQENFNHKINDMENEFKARFDSLENNFYQHQEKFDHKLNDMENEFKARFDSLENNFRTLLTTLTNQNDQNNQNNQTN
ncbi:8613_t:CDS:2 [Diversispora eburnea]|uniref:8613_t:CDS:1 n=1 Tax=Diversispora eburnea TaxID=1213867 RepID=A0A9N9GDP4_9GLOM|nr:8613_t:CDS:2 [Diversispora eburnea]